jgi:large conductance mechanosensitive channel
MKDFREFLLRGNLVDMAVGIVIGLAFAAVVTALVADLITPLIAAIGGNADFSSLSFTIAAAVFFLVVKPVNLPMERRKTEVPECMSEIPATARRCAFCTSEVGPAPATA